MSSRSRGNSFEMEARKLFESKGYQVERALAKLIWIPGRRVPISQSHDFFGLWDLIAKKLDERTFWIQVTTTNELSKKRKQMSASILPFNKWDCGLIYARSVNGGPKHFDVYYHLDGFKTKIREEKIP